MPQSVRAIAAHIAVVNGQPTTTTHDIAEVYGKRHDNVLKIVRQRIADAGEWGVLNFEETPYTDPQNGQTYPVVRMTKKGFHFVVGKFTGIKAVQHQIAYADEFERMEIALRGPAPTAIPYSVAPGQTLSAEEAAMLRSLITQHAETLPKEERARFIITAWSKLKAHFKTDYRHIPAHQFTEAVSILGRHMDLGLDEPRVIVGERETLNALCERLARHLLEPNGYPTAPFMPLWQAVNLRLAQHHMPRVAR